MKKRKSPHNEIKLDRFLHLIKYFSLFLILFFCLLLFKCKTHASSGDTTSYFPMEQNANNAFPDVVKSAIYSRFDNENNFIFFYTNDINIDGWTRGWVGVIAKNNLDTPYFYGEIQNNGYAWNAYSLYNTIITCYKVNANRSNGTLGVSYLGYNQAVFNNMVSNIYSTSYDYMSNFRIKTSNNDDASTVLKYGWELPPDFMHDTSHATPPDTFESPVYTTGHTPPTNVPPTYTINNYSWTTFTPPTIDTSNAETLLESIYNAIVYNGQYLKDNIHGELTNLVDNIGGFVEYIGDTMQYYGNLIISNIQNGITTFYNNINSAIVGIGNAVGYITQPLDMDNLTNSVNSTHIWGDVDTCTTFASDAFGIYGTVAEPNSFKIPLDLRSISLLNITQVYYIDLSWLDGAKTAIRAFMWCVVTFGLLYSIIVDIPNMIKSSK